MLIDIRFSRFSLLVVLLATLLCTSFATFASAEEVSSKNQDDTVATQESIKDKPSFKKRDNSNKAVGVSVPNLSSLATDMFKGLIYCGAAIFIFVSLLKRFTKQPAGDQSNPISIIGRRPLNSKISLLVVEAEGQKFLLSQSPEDVKLLSTIEQNFDFSIPLVTEESNALVKEPTKLARSAVS